MTTSYTRSARRASRREAARTKKYVAIVSCLVVFIGAAIAAVITRPWAHGPAHPIHPTQSVRYLGVYEPDAPHTYAGVNQFAQAIGRQPNLVSYYNSWLEPFQIGFATSAAKHGAVTVVQIDPKNVSLASIAAGQYDAYLRSYATAVKAFGTQVVLSFGHEMNGNWYSWGNQHTSPAVFVAAWRHVVTLFRAAGAENVTWLWTVNVIDNSIPIPDPAPWWPGGSYVNWVGIDGYYYLQSQSFSQVFGPTVVAIRNLTGDPILIAETSATRAANQPEKITNLFAGIHTYGILGFVWFNDVASHDYRLRGPAAIAAFRQGAKTYSSPAS